MARPKKKGLDYFPHDVHASSDEKIEAMRQLYGNDGYAFYFIILEQIYKQENCKLSLADKIFRTILRKKIVLENDLFEEMISTACKIGLFDSVEWKKSQVLTSKRVKDTARGVFKERKRATDKYRRNPGETPEKPDKQKQSKVNKSKVNNNNGVVDISEKGVAVDIGENTIQKAGIEAITSLESIFKNLSSREQETFAYKIQAIQDYCRTKQIDPQKEMAWVIETARQCRISTATNKKGLFISKINERYGFKNGVAV